MDCENLESSLRHLYVLFSLVALTLPAQADIFIGVAGPFSGQNNTYGNELRTGAAAAVSQINAQGGINGENLVLVEGDDGCDAKRAVDVAKTFVGKDVRMVVGHFCTSASLAAAPTYLNAGILMMNPSVTSPDLTSKNLWNVFRLTGRDDLQAAVAADRIKAEGQSAEVFVITDQQAETSAIANRFSTALPDAKTIVIKTGDTKLPANDALSVATAVYFALQPADAATMAKDIRKLNVNAKFYGPDLLQSETYGTRAGDTTDGARITFLQDNVTVADPQRASKLTSTEGATLAAYAAVEVFAAAANARNVNDTRGMANWLSSGNEVQSIIGPIRFNASGDLQKQPYAWYQWRNGSLSPE